MSKIFPITPKFGFFMYEENDRIFSNGIMRFDYELTLGHPNVHVHDKKISSNLGKKQRKNKNRVQSQAITTLKSYLATLEQDDNNNKNNKNQ